MKWLIGALVGFVLVFGAAELWPRKYVSTGVVRFMFVPSWHKTSPEDIKAFPRVFPRLRDAALAEPRMLEIVRHVHPYPERRDDEAVRVLLQSVSIKAISYPTGNSVQAVCCWSVAAENPSAKNAQAIAREVITNLIESTFRTGLFPCRGCPPGDCGCDSFEVVDPPSSADLTGPASWIMGIGGACIGLFAVAVLPRYRRRDPLLP